MPLNNSRALRRKAMIVSVAVGVLMFVMKVGGYLITNSAAVLSDAMESVVHVIATSMALYSVILASRPADRTHPYGYGKIEYFSAGVEGTLIVIAAIAICYEAARDIIYGNQLKSLDVGTWVVGTAGAINLILGGWLVRVGKRTGSLAVVADGRHVLTDSYTSIGVLIGLILVTITGYTLLDPIFAFAVALNIIITGYQLIRESFRGLMNVREIAAIEKIVGAVNQVRTPDMIDMHRLRSWKAGDRRFVDFHLVLPYYYSLKQGHTIQDLLADAINHEFNGDVEVMIHLDPCDCSACRTAAENRDDPPHPDAQPFSVAEAQGEPRYAAWT